MDPQSTDMNRWKAIIFYVCFLWVLIPFSGLAEMRPLGDDDLAEVAGHGGVDIWIKDFSFDLGFETIEYTDTDTGNSIEFNNIIVHDGTGMSAYIDYGDSPMTIDVFTVNDPSLAIHGQTFLSIVRPDASANKLYYTIENLVFSDQDLGRLDIGLVRNPYFHFNMTGHGTGISWEYGTEIEIDEIRFTYNTTPEYLEYSGIHLAESATGAPESPGTWAFSGPFKIGDMIENNMATFDVETFTATGQTHMLLNLPMSGTLRVEDVQFGGTDYGPIAIDGIAVHRLAITIPGN
jgi:hypothetical protein